jgi:putative spermidine/putrescine transport system ATP-binding protein/mannopine transport system ATP-binding protein
MELLVKRFTTLDATDHVSLEVGAGEFLPLLGPSCSGKTTILMPIAGFEYPDEGRIVVGTEEVTWAPRNRPNLGIVFQPYTLFRT